MKVQQKVKHKLNVVHSVKKLICYEQTWLPQNDLFLTHIQPECVFVSKFVIAPSKVFEPIFNILFLNTFEYIQYTFHTSSVWELEMVVAESIK